MECLHLLKDVGYQTGTGVMIGLPGQTVEMLADDLLFMHAFDIDMVGMGPYIEHEDTPLYKEKGVLLPIEYRLGLSFKMIAILRIMMKDINIAATTAMQSIDKMGREKAIKIGANVLMPNITPGRFRDRYQLYQNKPCTDDSVEDCMNCVEVRVGMTGNKVGYSKWGDSRHFFSRINKQS
jgi:biotin synthase